MRRVLIVSPHFPPLNAPDMHRVRMSLPHFRDSGWEPTVLAVKASTQEESVDASLMDLVPSDVQVVSVGALPLGLTRPAGLGNVGLRALVPLYFAGARLIRERRIDVVYFSTTMFMVTILGRIWKRQFGVPYVIDLQDPWYSTYYEERPHEKRPPKYRAAQWMHRTFERWTMRRVDQLVAVSPRYLTALGDRYPWLGQTPGATIPFGASLRDFEIARRGSGGPATARPSPWRGVYVGAAGPIMATAVRIVLRALKKGAGEDPVFERVALEFIGTAYAPKGRARKTIEPIAREEGVAAQVQESTHRIGYLEALRTLDAAGFLLLLGSDDPDYSPSKVYPYLLAQRPLVAVLHAQSPVVELLRRSEANVVITFGDRVDVEDAAARLTEAWRPLLQQLPDAPVPSLRAMPPFLAPELTRAQCAVLTAAARHHAVGAEVACPD